MKNIAKGVGGFIVLVLICFGLILLQLSLREPEMKEPAQVTSEPAEHAETEI